MALFDDPKKELQRLQEQLLAEEEPCEEEEEFYEEEESLEDILEEFGEEYEEEYEEEPAPRYRNFANDYGRAMTEALWEEEQDADRVVYSDEYRGGGKKKKKKKLGFFEALLLILLDVGLVAFLYWGWQNWIG